MDAFIGEIRLMGFGITPKNWAPCNGQTLPISQNQALFSVLGTVYGGDGVTTFRLPDLRGRVTTGYGQAPGLQYYAIGQAAGTESIKLTTDNMPAHGHAITGTLKAATTPTGADPTDSYPSQSPATQYSTGTSNTSLAANTLSGGMDNTGGGAAHENRQPVLALNYCIALQGYFPSRG